MTQKILCLTLAYILLSATMVLAGTIPELGLVYSGELKLTFLSENGQASLVPGYLLYLQGEPYPGLFVMTYLTPEGELVDQVFLQYTAGPLQIQLGDNTLQELGGEFFTLNQNQRGGVIKYALLGEAMQVEGMGAVVKGINHTDEIKGDGTIGPYPLTNGPVIPKTERVKKNGTFLAKEEYELDYEKCLITFNTPLAEDETVEVSYTYLPGGGIYERILLGANLISKWKGWDGKLSWLKFEDKPDTLYAGLPGKSLEAAIITGNWQGLKWIKLENHLAYSQVKGFQDYADWAYNGTLRLGNALNHIEGQYTYRGTDFLDSLDEMETEPIEGINAKARWQVTPTLYLFASTEYSHDNPEHLPEMITTQKKLHILKGQWSLTPTSSFQWILQKKDVSDDVKYLPLGEMSQTGAVIYRSQGSWPFYVSLEGGEWLWKDEASSGRNHRFMQLKTGLEWSKTSWLGNIHLQSKQIHPLVEAADDRIEHYLRYQAAYQLPKGEISLSGEEKLEEDFKRHVQEISIKGQLARPFYLLTKYQRKVEIHPNSTNVTPEHSITMQGTYRGNLTIDMRGIVTFASTYAHPALSIQTQLKAKKSELKVIWKSKEGKTEADTRLKLTLTPDLTGEVGLTYLKNLEEEKFSLVAASDYRFTPNTKLKLFCDIPLIEMSQGSTYKIELIISL